MILKSLNAKQVAIIIATISCIVLLDAVYGIYELHIGHKHRAFFYCLLALVILLTLPIHISNLLRIKKSGAMILRPVSLPQLPRIPFFVSATFTISLTIAIAVVTYQSFFADLIAHPTRPLRWDMAGFNLFLWLLVGLIWYCLIATREQKHYKLVPEQPEGVWPPAPLAVEADKNED